MNVPSLSRPLSASQAQDFQPERLKLQVENFSLHYGREQVLQDIHLALPAKRVTAFIGPSGCGKSTLLRSFNRLNDLIEGCVCRGDIRLDQESIYAPGRDVVELRRRVGMVFQKPNPFPKSIYENVAFGLRVQGIRDRRTLDDVVEFSLRAAALWDEVKDRLHDNGFDLSGGQHNVW